MPQQSSNRTEFIVLSGQIVGSGPFETVYAFDGERFADRKLAILHGLKIRGSDDFNIGVVDGGRLKSVDWMEQVVDEDSSLMAEIAEQICLS